MKRIAYLLTTLFLLASCSSDDSVPAPQIDWTPDISRAATGGQELRVVGRQAGTDKFDKVLIPAAESGGKATWKDGKPDWSGVDQSESMEFIAFLPSGSALPVRLVHDGVTEYRLDYQQHTPRTSKPASFSLTQLMAKLQIHIWVEETEMHTPEADSVSLYTEADIDFPNKVVKNLSARKRVCLGTFSQSATMEQTGSRYDKFSLDCPLIVLPQTLPAGEEVLWFSIEDAYYYFKPEEPIELKAGYLTELTLHVAFVEEEGDDSADRPIAIGQSAVTVTDWTEIVINAGEAEE